MFYKLPDDFKQSINKINFIINYLGIIYIFLALCRMLKRI